MTDGDIKKDIPTSKQDHFLNNEILDHVNLVKNKLLLLNINLPNDPVIILKTAALIIEKSYNEVKPSQINNSKTLSDILSLFENLQINLEIFDPSNKIIPDADRLVEYVKIICEKFQQMYENCQKLICDKAKWIAEREQYMEYTGWTIRKLFLKNETILKIWAKRDHKISKSEILNNPLELPKIDLPISKNYKKLKIKSINQETLIKNDQNIEIGRLKAENNKLNNIIRDLKLENRYLLGRCAMAYENSFAIKNNSNNNNQEIEDLKIEYLKTIKKIKEDYDFILMRELNENANR